MTREAFIEAARSFKETPWQERGRSINGVDCGGFLVLLFRHINLVPEDFDAFVDGSGVYNSLHSSLLLVADEIDSESQLLSGDILTYSFLGGESAHCAVYCADNNTIIHAYASLEKVCEHSCVGKWTKRIHRVYRPRGLDG